LFDPRKSSTIKQSRYESAEKEGCRRTKLILDNQAQINLKQFKRMDMSKESIRYSRINNSSLAHDSSIQIVSRSRCSQIEGSGGHKSAQRYNKTAEFSDS
jgi:hypothetical protein